VVRCVQGNFIMVAMAGLPSTRLARWTAAAAVVIAGCSAPGCGVVGAETDSGSGAADAEEDSGNFPACAQSLSDYCAEAGALCPRTWDSAPCLENAQECGGLSLYTCNGLDVALCSFDEGGGYTLLFDPSSHALVAAAWYPSLIGAGGRHCYVGPESLRSTLQSGPPNCPTGPLYGTPGPDGGLLFPPDPGVCL
jgi:hypothetical protein